MAHVLFGDSSPTNVQRVAHGNAVLGSYTTHPYGGVVVTSGCTDWAYGVAGGDPLITQITRTILDTMSAPSMAKADGA